MSRDPTRRGLHITTHSQNGCSPLHCFISPSLASIYPKYWFHGHLSLGALGPQPANSALPTSYTLYVQFYNCNTRAATKNVQRRSLDCCIWQVCSTKPGVTYVWMPIYIIKACLASSQRVCAWQTGLGRQYELIISPCLETFTPILSSQLGVAVAGLHATDAGRPDRTFFRAEHLPRNPRSCLVGCGR